MIYQKSRHPTPPHSRNSYTKMASCVSNGNTKNVEPPRKVSSSVELFEGLSKAWSRPLKESCTAKDVARLATRIDVHTTEPTQKDSTETKTNAKGTNHGSSSNERKTTSKTTSDVNSSSNESRMNAILIAVRQLATFFSVNVETAITETSSAFSGTSTSDNPDLSIWVGYLLDQLGGDSSPIVRVFKCFHQNILFAGIVQLKQGVLKDIQTKDSRTNDGWRIRVTTERGRVQVTHRRKEVINDVSGNQHLMWEMSLTFNGDVSTLCSTSLRLTGLSLDDQCKGKERRNLMRKLSSGNLIIS
jgi:hypothetical protein